ncbi:MAG: S9 family peptidase [Herpetosiphon sp.]
MTEHRRFTPESLLEMRGVSDPQVAPDGRRVAYVEHWIENVTKNDKELPAYRSCIMFSDGPDREPRRLTWQPKGKASMPRFSPDGRYLAYLSTQASDAAQLYVLDLEGGDGRPVTDEKSLSDGVISFDWHPDSDAFCLISTGHRSKEDQKLAHWHDEKVYENQLPVKFDGHGLREAHTQQVWRVGRNGNQLVQLFETPFDVDGARWSPKGDRIVYLTLANIQLQTTHIRDLFIYDLQRKDSQQVTPSQGPIYDAVWSPDGTQLAFVGHNGRRGNATNLGIWLIEASGGDPRCITATFDRSIGAITMGDMHFVTAPPQLFWQGTSIFFPSTDHGRSGIHRVSINGGEVASISTSGLSALTMSVAGTTIAFSGETNVRIAEVYTMTTEGQEVKRRSHAADDVMRTFEVAPVEHVAFKGSDGLPLEGWYIKPLHHSPGKQYPLILYIHGGPHAAYGNGFFHEFQVLAQAGFGLLYVNPRGGSSYGEEFTDAVRGHYGEGDYEDLMQAADLAASWDWVDADRMGVMGGSYGGFMTNWIITHTDRFKAACTQRSISNWVSFAGTSDIGPEFTKQEMKGIPWEDEERLMAKSPLRYVKNVKTPTLILNQENDHRCPIEQAEQFYTALVCLGVPTRFVRFPDESHGLSRNGKPFRRVNRMNYIVDWFRSYLKPEE